MAQETRQQDAAERQARWESRLSLWAVVCAGTFGIIAVLSLVGWWVGEAVLRKPFPDEPATSPNSALALMLGSIAVAFVVRRPGQNRTITTVAAIGVLVIGIATFLEHAFDESFGIDGVLVGHGVPRMAEASAFGYVMLGVGLVLLAARFGAPILRQVIFGLAFAVGFVGALGHLYGGLHDSPLGAFMNTSPVTAAGLLVIGAAAFFAQPETVPGSLIADPGPSGILVRRLLPTILIAFPAIGAVCLLGHEAGWYDVRFAFVLAIASSTVCVIAVLIGTADVIRHVVREREAAERSERDTYQRYRQIMDNAPFSTVVKDMEGRFVAVNRKGLDNMGFADERVLLGRRPAEIFDNEWAYAGDSTDRLVRGGDSIEYEVVIEVDGRPRTFTNLKFPIRDAEGEVIATVAVGGDITDQRLAEQQNARLMQERQHAERLEALGQLAGGVAHDFNNLLTVITNYAEFARAEVEAASPTAAADLAQILRASERAAALTRKLLAFGRREPARPEPLDLNHVVLDVKSLLQRTLGEHVVLRTELATDPWHAVADRNQIENVLVNLAINARDAMPDGGELCIETCDVVVTPEEFGHSVEPGNYAGLIVRDTGIGMTAEVLAHAFEPFFTTKGAGAGTGLGLASVYGTISQAGGEITVESTPGAGAAFTILLPATSEESGLRPLPAEGGGNAGRGHVLVVDDESAICELTRRLLARHGYDVQVAGSGAEALEVLGRDGPFDLLLTDVVMPGMSGRELATAAVAAHPELRVQLMSGYAASAGDGATAELDVLGKPFTERDLLGRVEQILDLSGQES
ncbi:MAG: ATP-binding protein [Acidimicrobiia bacterium]